MSDLLTTAQAADELGVCVETIRRMIRDGLLPAARVRGQYRIHRGHLPQPEVRVPEVDVRSARPWPVQPGRALKVALKARADA